MIIHKAVSQQFQCATHSSVEQPIKLLIADQYETVRYGLRVIFSERAQVTIVGEADSPEMLRAILVREHADVILFDLCNADEERLALVQATSQSYPAIRFLVFAEHLWPFQIDALIQAGASGFVSKRTSADQLFLAIVTIYHNQRLALARAHALLFDVRYPTSPFGRIPHENLTQRELEVLQYLVDGKTNKELAALLSLATKTVEARVAQICIKLNARSRTDAAVRAVYLGLVRPYL